MTSAWFVALLAGGVLLANATLALRFRRDLVALWRETVLRYPVLIVESDDWGPGPDFHADRLVRLADILARYRDSRGHPAVMTLGVTLAIPDGRAIRESSGRLYRGRRLDDPAFARIRDAMLAGQSAGVFELQLHGLEHFWPEALLRAARDDDQVRAWFTQEGLGTTEQLPPAFQARWVDGSRLPSTPLPAGEAERVAAEEVAVFESVFGCPARVAVPPTFTWPLAVEAGWASAGIQVVVTPGQRFESRDEAGRPVATGHKILNGQTGRAGITYLVRDCYFEPSFGHSAQRGISALNRKWREGRPALVETHRFNFIGPESETEKAFAELDGLLQRACRCYPDLRFTTPEILARALREVDREWVTDKWLPRVRAWLRRLPDVQAFWRLAKLSGGRIAIACAAYLLDRAASLAHSPRS